MDIAAVLHNKTPLELLTWLDDSFSYEAYPHMTTPDEVNLGLDMMQIQASILDFLMEMLSYAKIYTRDLKRKGKEYRMDYEDMVDKKEIIENKISAIKVSYQTTNKCVTVFMNQNQLSQNFSRGKKDI